MPAFLSTLLGRFSIGLVLLCILGVIVACWDEFVGLTLRALGWVLDKLNVVNWESAGAHDYIQPSDIYDCYRIVNLLFPMQEALALSVWWFGIAVFVVIVRWVTKFIPGL